MLHSGVVFLEEPPDDDSVRAPYEADRASDGYVMNLTRLWAWRPAVLTAYVRARSAALEEAGLSERDVALLVVASAAARNDSYCARAWGTKLARHTTPETAAAVIWGAPADLDERGTTLVAWARRVATDPNSATADDVARLRAVGLDDRQIFSATTFIALRMAFSTVNDALGARPDHQLVRSAPGRVRTAVDFGRPAACPTDRQARAGA